MKQIKKRLLAGATAALLALSLVPSAFAAEPLTRREARDILLAASEGYVSADADREILKGDENGDLHLDRTLTRAEALVMLERAFGGLPTPVGANARSGFSAEVFTDVPDWAQAELTGVLNAGIVAGTGDGLLSPQRPVTDAELDLLLRRV